LADISKRYSAPEHILRLSKAETSNKMCDFDVEKYFTTIGVGLPKSEAVFVKNGRKRFGRTFDQMVRVIEARADGSIEDPYEIKNSSLDLSLYAGEYYTSAIWRAFAQWLIREELPNPQSVLDLGCENGILTCLLASIWPGSKVVVIDRSEAAVVAARELAARLRLENVTFEKIDGLQFLTREVNKFSVITTTPSMHEILQLPNGREPFHWDEPYSSLEDVRLTSIDEPAIAVLEQVRNALAPSGLFISLDRSPTSATTWWYVQCLQEAGLSVSIRRSYKITAKARFGTEKLPIIVAERACEGGKKITPGEVLSLMSFQELAELAVVFEDDVADIFARGLGSTEVMFEATAEYEDDSGIRTLRLLRTATFLILHDFTNHGYVKASLAPLVALGDVIAQCQSIARDLEDNAIVTASITDAGKALLQRFGYSPVPSPAAAPREASVGALPLTTARP
jgi:SAM-dependent methyltransferase